MRRCPVMLRQNPTDPLRPRRMFRGDVAAATGHDCVHVGLVRVAVRRVHIVVIIVVVIIVVIVVILEWKTFTVFMYQAHPRLHVREPQLA